MKTVNAGTKTAKATSIAAVAAVAPLVVIVSRSLWGGKATATPPSVAAAPNQAQTPSSVADRVYRQGDYAVYVGSERQHSTSLFSFYWGELDGETSQKPISVVRLRVTYKSKAVEVPLSCYNDLCDVSDVTLSSTGCVFTIRLRGGDAGTSYICQIHLRKNLVVSREVHSGEFYDEAKESTQYHFVPDDGR